MCAVVIPVTGIWSLKATTKSTKEMGLVSNFQRKIRCSEKWRRRFMHMSIIKFFFWIILELKFWSQDVCDSAVGTFPYQIHPRWQNDARGHSSTGGAIIWMGSIEMTLLLLEAGQSQQSWMELSGVLFCYFPSVVSVADPCFLKCSNLITSLPFCLRYYFWFHWST